MAPRKNRKKAKSGGDNLTDAEWAAMNNFPKFVIIDEQRRAHPFAVDDCVSVLPPNTGKENGPPVPIKQMWIGSIKEIRARKAPDGEDDAWARIQWFYSKDDVAELVPSFDTTHIGANERILSDHFDYVHSSCLDDVIPIHRYRFDPTYEDASTSSSRSTRATEANLQRLFYQKEIRATIENDASEDGPYPDIFYRYDFEVTSKQRRFSPKVTQFSCFSVPSTKLYQHLTLGTRTRSKSKKARHENSCFAESLYSPPDSDHAREIGEQIALLASEAAKILESAVTCISERCTTTPTKRSSSRLQSSSLSASRSPSSAGATRSSRSTAMTTRTRTAQQISSTTEPVDVDVDVLIHTTSRQLLHKMQQAMLLEDTLAMHLCPRMRCKGPCGRSWHRSCLIRDKIKVADEGLENGSGIDEDDNYAESSLRTVKNWISGNSHRRTSSSCSPPTLAQIQALWEGMSESQRMEVDRMIRLLCTIPPGCDKDNGQGEYDFPILLDNTVSQASNRKGKRRASEQEEWEVTEDLLPTDIDPVQLSSSSRKRRHSSDDETRVDVDDDPDDPVPRIMHTLSLLLAPELICLASQPMVRGGVLEASSPPSSSSPSFLLTKNSPMFNSNSATITGNISQVSHARIAVYSVLDEMAKTTHRSEMDVDDGLPEMEPPVVPAEWANYVVELEGREWLFELLSGSLNNGNGRASKGKSRASNKRRTSALSSKEETRSLIIVRTHTLLRQWQVSRRRLLLCPHCEEDI